MPTVLGKYFQPPVAIESYLIVITVSSEPNSELQIRFSLVAYVFEELIKPNIFQLNQMIILEMIIWQYRDVPICHVFNIKKLAV